MGPATGVTSRCFHYSLCRVCVPAIFGQFDDGNAVWNTTESEMAKEQRAEIARPAAACPACAFFLVGHVATVIRNGKPANRMT